MNDTSLPGRHSRRQVLSWLAVPAATLALPRLGVSGSAPSLRLPAHRDGRAPAGEQRGLLRPTLLVYNTVQGLLAGDLLNAVTVPLVRSDLGAFPPNWPVVGVGTTNMPDRTGELFPDGTAANLRFWWADPDSPSQAAVEDLGLPPRSALVRMPFLALALADPADALTWRARNVPDVHAWLKTQMAAAGIELAGVLLEGDFGQVKTSVSYNLPLTGLDLSGGYVGDDYFRFGDYASAVWHLNGIYASQPALTNVISTPNNPVHLHGYQPAAMLGGHITSAVAEDVSVTVWPLAQMIVRRGSSGPAK